MLTPDAINKKAVQLAKSSRYKFNCWAFTALVEGWGRRVCWYDREDMERLLRDKTRPVNYRDLQPSDILVYRSLGHLTHTAIFLGNDRLIHKPGRGRIEIMDVDEMECEYPIYGDLTECRRPIECKAPVECVQLSFWA